MDSQDLLQGALWFLVFLFSTTCHEAAHAWAAKRGGDLTAYAAGQVSLDPLPHIRREPVGMVVVPWLFFFMNGTMMGWASAPFDPGWARTYPRRAAWMALAGPAANFAIVVVSGLLITAGRAGGALVRPSQLRIDHIVASASGGAMEGVAALLSVAFVLNLLLGTFNLLPIPPLDGFDVLGIFLPEAATRKLMDIRQSLGMLAMLGILVAWQAFDYVFMPILVTGIRLLYLPQF
jgi:Zn-dependent protease